MRRFLAEGEVAQLRERHTEEFTQAALESTLTGYDAGFEWARVVHSFKLQRYLREDRAVLPNPDAWEAWERFSRARSGVASLATYIVGFKVGAGDVLNEIDPTYSYLNSAEPADPPVAT